MVYCAEAENVVFIQHKWQYKPLVTKRAERLASWTGWLLWADRWAWWGRVVGRHLGGSMSTWSDSSSSSSSIKFFSFPSDSDTLNCAMVSSMSTVVDPRDLRPERNRAEWFWFLSWLGFGNQTWLSRDAISPNACSARYSPLTIAMRYGRIWIWGNPL